MCVSVTIYNLVDRVFKLSHNKFHKKNITFIKKLLIHNNYPPKLIKLHIKKRLKKLRNAHNNTPQNSNKKTFISLPYVKELENFLNIFFKKYNTNIVYSTKNKLNNIIKLTKTKTKSVIMEVLFTKLTAKIVMRHT